MFTARLRCHFCGTRSSHPKGVREFECSNCEAHNFYDDRGNVVDTPASIASQPPQIRPDTKSRLASSLPPSETSTHQRGFIFCRTCVQNQLLYTQALANYLPEEDHPRYRELEAALPQYRAQLEKRYPQVCRKCAPSAQSNINRADYYSKTQLISKLASARKARDGKSTTRTRDNWKKKLLRLLLNLIGSVSLTALLSQIAFHAYGALLNLRSSSLDKDGGPESFLEPTLRSCAGEALSIRFDTSCFTLFSSVIPFTIVVSTALLWYNPGMNAWNHHTIRIESVKGQQQYFWVHALIIAIRCVAWYSLSDASILDISDHRQLAALHFSAILLMVLFHMISTQAIKPVAWKMKGKAMPRPEDRDVLGLIAGPEQENYTPRASEKDPWRYLRKQSNGPFDINSLAPQATTLSARTHTQWPDAHFPSPEDTETSDADDGDEMETDFQPVMRSSFKSQVQPCNSKFHSETRHSASQPLGWSDMRGEIFSMQDQMRVEQERKLQAQQSAQHASPFRGKLPLAPMSMERRLRNPVTQPVEPVRIPLSQQKNFFSQMSTGIKPITFPEKGSNMELRKSTWTLPGDVHETGLEDLMGGNSFRIDDETSPGHGTGTSGWFSSLIGRNRE